MQKYSSAAYNTPYYTLMYYSIKSQGHISIYPSAFHAVLKNFASNTRLSSNQFPRLHLYYFIGALNAVLMQ